MGKPVVVLFTLTNTSEQHTYAVYALKAYATAYLKHKPNPRILLQIYKVKRDSYGKDNVSLKVTSPEISRIAKDILKKRPQIVGFSCNIVNRNAIMRIAKAIKKADPRVTVVVGGPEMHQYYFHDMPSFHTTFPGIDIIALFEGEQTLVEIIESLIYHKFGLSRVKGIIYRDGERLIKNENRLPEDLSRLPSPFLTGNYPIKTKSNEIIIENSRGCPYRCAYCSFPIGNNHYLRYFPVQRVQKELEYLLRLKIKYLTLSDSNFNINKIQTVEILKTIIKFNKNNDTKIRVFFNASREVIDDEYLKLLSRSQIRLVLGVQSVSKQTLKIAHRYDNLEILENNLRRMDRYDVNYSLEFIFGLPGDDYDDIRRDINWIFRFNAKMAFFYRLVMIPGTYFYTHAPELGLVYDAHPPNKIMSTAKLSNTHIENIDKLLALVYHFYNNIRYREQIRHICTLFNLRHDQVFEIMAAWYKGSRKDLLDKKVLETTSKNFFSYLLEHSHMRREG